MARNPQKKAPAVEVKEKRPKKRTTSLIAGLEKKLKSPGVTEQELLKSIRKYDNPGQWLGNRHPITRF